MPRPGSRRLRSGTADPSGPSTKRIISATGLTVPVAAQNRSTPGPPWRAPASSPCSCDWACMGCDGSSHVGFGRFRRRFLHRRRRQILFLDPAGLDARLHDQRLGFVARQIETVENARLALGLAMLALGPAATVVAAPPRPIP